MTSLPYHVLFFAAVLFMLFCRESLYLYSLPNSADTYVDGVMYFCIAFLGLDTLLDFLGDADETFMSFVMDFVGLFFVLLETGEVVEAINLIFLGEEGMEIRTAFTVTTEVAAALDGFNKMFVG